LSQLAQQVVRCISVALWPLSQPPTVILHVMFTLVAYDAHDLISYAVIATDRQTDRHWWVTWTQLSWWWFHLIPVS